MEHVITVKNVLVVVLAIGGFVAVLAVLFFILDLTNPFRSGH